MTVYIISSSLRRLEEFEQRWCLWVIPGNLMHGRDILVFRDVVIGTIL